MVDWMDGCWARRMVMAGAVFRNIMWLSYDPDLRQGSVPMVGKLAGCLVERVVAPMVDMRADEMAVTTAPQVAN